jgi:drug/metabolite transporter (DMT)-like permease
LLDVSANVSLVVALRAGSLAVAAVAASFYPAITVVMARLVNAEHVRWQQALGLALTIVAMSAIALS